MAEENLLKDTVIPIITVASFIGSLFSIGLSLLTLYLTQFRKAKIKVFPNEHLNIGYFEEGNFQLILSLLIVNNGTETAVINRFSLIIQDSETNDGYLLEPYYFQKINDEGHFQSESNFYAIALGSKQNVTKLILFRSSLENLNEFNKITPGEYNLTLLGWTDNFTEPSFSSSFAIEITSEVMTQLESDLQNKTGKTVRIPRKEYSKFQPKPLNEDEIRGFYSGKKKGKS